MRLFGKFGYPMIAVSAITDKVDELTSRANLFFTLGTTTAFVNGVKKF